MIIAFSFLSLLEGDFQDKIKQFNNLTNTDWIHFDVMDGKFVSNKTFDATLIKKINQDSHLFSDVHLMITDLPESIGAYISCKPNQITFHYEAIEKEQILALIEKIHSNNIKVGMSIKPDTKVEVLDDYLPYLDYVLVMSVEPGKGGQKFMDNSIEKIKYLKDRKGDYHYLIGVDGGINNLTINLVKAAGADVAIVGSYLANHFSLETLNNLK